MMSEGALGAYFWGVYVWFVIGFTMIAVPAIFQIIKIFSVIKRKDKTVNMEGEMQ